MLRGLSHRAAIELAGEMREILEEGRKYTRAWDRYLAKKGAEAGEEKLKRWRAMPGWLVVTCENSADPIQAREDYAACCCAIQNLMLALWGEGIGVKWNTGVVINDPRFCDLILVDPQVETVVGLFWYGYPAEVPETRRKSVEEILIELP